MLFCKRQQATTIGSERQQTQILGLGLTQRPSMLSMPSDCWGGPLRATFARQSAPLHAGMFVTPVMLPRLSPALGFHQIRSCTKSQRAPGVVVDGATVFAPWRRNHFHMVHSRRTMLMWCSAADAKERKWIAWKDHNFRSCDCKPLEIP